MATTLRLVFSSLALALGATAPGCSSAGGGDDATGGSPATGGTPTSTATGGSTTTGGTGSGGSSGTTGGMASTTGGSSGAMMCEAIASVAPCSGISTGKSCPMEGLNCPGLPCGVADVGRRTCDCTGGIWSCETCVFPMDFATCPIMEPPAAPLEACAAGTSDTVSCSSTKGQRCMNGAEVCICWPDDEGAVAWDCDKPPMFWSLTE